MTRAASLLVVGHARRVTDETMTPDPFRYFRPLSFLRDQLPGATRPSYRWTARQPHFPSLGLGAHGAAAWVTDNGRSPL